MPIGMFAVSFRLRLGRNAGGVQFTASSTLLFQQLRVFCRTPNNSVFLPWARVSLCYTLCCICGIVACSVERLTILYFFVALGALAYLRLLAD
jgi:hypothetical protein